MPKSGQHYIHIDDLQEDRAERRIDEWLKSSTSKALLVTGVRQVGKMYSMRKVLKDSRSNIVEISFIELHTP